MKSLSRKSAFTLIELILAVAVVIVMTAVAIPSFSTVNQGNTWSDNLQSITNCLQDAQKGTNLLSTGASQGTLRYTAAQFTYSNGSLQCQDLGYYDTNGKPATLPGLVSNGSGGTLMSNAVTMTGLSLTSPPTYTSVAPGNSSLTVTKAMATFYLYFWVVDAGPPVAYFSSNGGGSLISQGTNPNFAFSLQLFKASDSSSSSIIALPGLGAPLTVTNN